MLQRSGGLRVVYEEKDKLSTRAIALIHDRTATYNPDTTEVGSDERQEDHKMLQNRLQWVQRSHNAHRATLKYMHLVEYIGLISTGQRYLCGFCYSLIQGLQNCTFPMSSSLHQGRHRAHERITSADQVQHYQRDIPFK